MPLDVSRPLSGKSTVFGLSRFSCLVIAEALLIGAISLQTGSIFFSDWRVGSGDTFMYPPNITQGFTSRLYGLIYVEGLRKITWAELATNTCDRWGLYINTKPLFPTAPACSSDARTDNFENHLRLRCANYSSITLLNWVTIGLLCLSAVLCAATAIFMLLVPLGKWKRYILASLFSASAVSFPTVLAWGALTQYFFKQLSTTATYPMPHVGIGAWLALAGTTALVVSTFIFWRLTHGLKILSSAAEAGGKIGTSNAGLLDMAEHKFLVKGKLADDTDEEAPSA